MDDGHDLLDLAPPLRKELGWFPPAITLVGFAQNRPQRIEPGVSLPDVTKVGEIHLIALPHGCSVSREAGRVRHAAVQRRRSQSDPVPPSYMRGSRASTRAGRAFTNQWLKKR